MTGGCSSASQDCYACDADYHWSGTACVPDTTCTSDCTVAQASTATTKCKPDGSNIIQTCTQVEPSCYQWTTTETCTGDTPFCDGGRCVECLDDQTCIDNSNFGCEYRCDGAGYCTDASYSLCAGSWSSCFFDPDLCQCVACAATETCTFHSLMYTCDVTCTPANCQFGCSQGRCIDCTSNGDCTALVPVGMDAACVAETCSGSACSFPPNNAGGACTTAGGLAGTCQSGACVSTTTYYRDADADTHGNPLVTSTTGGGGWVLNDDDCDDANAAIHPGATELCNGVDDDCDALIDAVDPGMRACPAGQTCKPSGSTYTCQGDDCTCAGATCGETPTGCTTECPGSCVSGTCLLIRPGDYACGSLTTTGPSSATAGNSFSITGTLTVTGGSGSSAIQFYREDTAQGTPVTCTFNGGTCAATRAFTENTLGTYGYATGIGSFITAELLVTITNACDPLAQEICNNIDDNCGGIDEGCDDDNDGYADATMTCTNNFRDGSGITRSCAEYGNDCDDNNPNRNPGLAEGCGDNIDNDCDGAIDGADSDWPQKYYDRDLDGYGDTSSGLIDGCTGCVGTTCSGGFSSVGGDCFDSSGMTGGLSKPDGWYANPGWGNESLAHSGACFDTWDNDCDGIVDENDPDCDTITCDFGQGTVSCDPYSETETEWRRDGTTCQAFEWILTTTYFGPNCGATNCEYSHQSTTETQTTAIRDWDDGATCTEELSGYCVAGVCSAACLDQDQPGCQESQPANSHSTTGACPTSQSCYACDADHVWSGRKCKKTQYSIDTESVIAVAGDTFIMTPVTYDDHNEPVANVLYRYSGFRKATTNEPFTIITKADEVGTHTLSIAASRIVGDEEEPLATTTLEIGLRCPSGIACCPAGSLTYAPFGTECAVMEAEGFCDHDGVCQPICGQVIVLENSATKCSDGIDNDCDGVYDCIRTQDGRTEGSCEPYCQAYCARGQKACGPSCVDTDTDRNHCGDCGISCAVNEQCDQGRCITLAGCFVACEENEDCGDEQICNLPGSCDAYCQDLPVVVMNETARQDLLTSVVKQKTFEITKSLDRRGLTIEIKNLLAVPLDNFTMTITIPKELAATASEISSNRKYEVLHDDPVIRTTIPTIGNRQVVRFDFVRDIDPAYINTIVIDAEHGYIDLASTGMLEDEDLVITRSFHEDADGTTVTLTLKPGQILENVRVPLEIPKCLANTVSEMDIKQENFVVVNEDPLMVWTFDELSSQQQISFTVPKNVDDDCRKQLKAFGMASGKRKPVSPWLPLAIIPVIGFVLLFFQRFHESGAKRHLSKSEFYSLAKQQGQSDTDIERAWHEYKRKF